MAVALQPADVLYIDRHDQREARPGDFAPAPRAQDRLQLLSTGWAGRTRIGECLAAFNGLHVGRLVHARTAVIIASDGYDTGPAALLRSEMATLRRRGRRIIWFNPAQADPRYRPLARGMREALPFIDQLSAGKSRTALEDALSTRSEVL